MYLEDMTFGLFRSIALDFGLRSCYVLGAAVGCVGLILVARKWLPRLGWSLVGTGAMVAWVAFLAVSECRSQEVLSEFITARYYTYADATRELAQLGLLAIPALGVLVKLGRDKLFRDRRRSLLSTYLRIATKAYYSGDFDRAIAEYSIAIRVDPSRVECYVRRGKAWAQKGEYVRAIADFDRALKFDIDLGAAYLNRGVVLAARGDHLEAIDDYDQALCLSPTDASPLLHRGLSFAKLGELSRAGDDFRKILRITNHSDFTEPARFHLAMLEDELRSQETAVGP